VGETGTSGAVEGMSKWGHFLRARRRLRKFPVGDLVILRYR